MSTNKMYRFTVAGRSYFPTDMLRYDACWPRFPDDSAAVGARHEDITIVHLASHRKPTEGRWASFMWPIQECQEIKV